MKEIAYTTRIIKDLSSVAIAAIFAKLSEIDLGCVDLIDLFRVGSKDQSLH